MGTSVVRVDEKKLTSKRAELQAMVSSIVVRDAETCLTAKTTQRDIRLEVKMVHAVLDPFVVQAKDAYDKAKEEREKYIAPLEALDGQLAIKVKDYERLERERAEAEQRRINEERRRKAELEAAEQRKRDEEAAAERRKEDEKRIAEARKAGEIKAREAEKMRKEAEERERKAKEQAAQDAQKAKDSVQDVKVQAAIPTVAGVPSRLNYKAEVTHPERIINAYVDAVSLRNTDRAVYLRQFVMVNEQAIGAEARKVKNSKQMESLIPGVRFYEE